MRIRFVVAALLTALAAVACSSVVNGKGRPGSALPNPPTPSSSVPVPSPTISVPTPPVSSVPVPPTSAPVSFPTSSVPITSAPPPTGSSAPTTQADFACPYIVFPAAHLSFVCVAKKMTKNTKAKPWPIVWQKPVAHFKNNGVWTLDTGAGHWPQPQGSDSLRDIAVEVRNQMVDLGEYGKPAPAVQTSGKQIQVSGHPAYELQTTFTINAQFRQQNGVPIKQEKSWIVAVDIAPNDVSLWYVSVPDAVKYLWPQMDSLISTISVS